MKEEIRFLLTGVGGQGTLLASNVLAEVGMALGYDVKKAEVHGMSQRGGSVVSHVRWGEKVFSPIIPDGEGDILLAFEKLEAIRFVRGLKPGGLALINEYEIVPVTVSSGPGEYPPDEEIYAAFDALKATVKRIPAIAIAEELGSAKVANVVMLGALSRLMNHPSKTWMEVIERRVPAKFVDLNRKAFQAGREAMGG